MNYILCTLLAFTWMAAPAHAEQKLLRWAADAESGAPYVFVDPNDPNKMVGFEKEIMDAVAREMNRKLMFVQNAWEGLIPGLSRSDYDVAANGIEITEDRAREVLFSDPYYATFEQLMVRTNDNSIHDLKDLAGHKVGTLKATLAHHILETQTKAEILFYEEESEGFTDLDLGRIDAFFIDYPVALYYGFPNKKLKPVGPPIGKLVYGIAMSKKSPDLRDEINHALVKIRESGELAEVLERWNLLHPVTQQMLGLRPRAEANSTEYDRMLNQKHEVTFTERMQRYWKIAPLLAKGAALTMGISICAMFFAMIFGLALVAARLYGPKWLHIIAVAWIEAIRGTPLLIQLFLIFYGLPYIGIKFSPFWAAVIGLGMNYGTNEAENYRAGIEAVPKSQLEASQALALKPLQRFFFVIFPQAYKIILPPVTNDFIALLKDSSLVSIITMVELTTEYTQLASTYFDHLGLGLLVALIYFLLGYPFVRLARHFEMRLKAKA